MWLDTLFFFFSLWRVGGLTNDGQFDNVGGEILDLMVSPLSFSPLSLQNNQPPPNNQPTNQPNSKQSPNLTYFSNK